MRYLIVDDSPSFRDLLSLELGAENVRTARTILEGLAMVQRERYDVILLDHWFGYGPHHGIGSIAAFQSLARDADIVMLTADCDIGDKALAMESGAAGYVEKGDMEQLWEVLLALADVQPVSLRRREAVEEEEASSPVVAGDAARRRRWSQ